MYSGKGFKIINFYHGIVILYRIRFAERVVTKVKPIKKCARQEYRSVSTGFLRHLLHFLLKPTQYFTKYKIFHSIKCF